MAMLEVRGLSVSYGQHRALENVSIKVSPGEIVVILGANGAGKSTLLKTIGGIAEGTGTGSVTIDGDEVLGLPTHKILERGVALVPENRGIFSDLTVHENLMLGAYNERARRDQEENFSRVFDLFPKLAERKKQVVRTMSGGEQQMVAIGRAMMSAPSIVMLDEPSLGLSPLLCGELFQNLKQVRESGVGILLVEQNARQSLAIADRGYLLENAQIVGHDNAENLAGNPLVQQAYLGGVAAKSEALLARPSRKSSEVAMLAPETVERPTGAVRSDDIVPGGIDDLVQRATRTQDRHVERNRPQVSLPSDRTERTRGARPNGRLGEVLAEIEQAARDARLDGSGEAAADGAEEPLRKPNGEYENDDDLPEIEIWRRPQELEIYRRDPEQGSRMIRVEGEDDG
jgi:branched-chain amino acid transport system ATP-binding protein